ncbi:hypothetical protein ACQCVB_04910 [Fictibacillus phosphorivorans]|uniref:hypothetical protein n=1 Tax=Fictibacillus phosphorivorans TaxID=1221500 RepID=UPI003CEC001A
MVRLDRNLENRVKKTCRNSCELYDWITEGCSIKRGVNIDDPNTLRCCNLFLCREYMRNLATNQELISEWKPENENQVIGDDDKNYENSLYPLQPDRPSQRDDAVWFVSTCKSYGCWLINKFKKKFVIISNSKVPEQGWSKKVYKSPYPLHNHMSPLAAASRIAWYVDEEGFGQYVMLINGEIATFTSKKPENWRKLICRKEDDNS